MFNVRATPPAFTRAGKWLYRNRSARELGHNFRRPKFSMPLASQYTGRHQQIAGPAFMVSVVSGSTAALQGLINRDQMALNDWVTCVSAKTPKGHAEIQKFSGEISSAKERIARIEASEPRPPSAAPDSTATPAASAATSLTPSPSAPSTTRSQAPQAQAHAGRLDVWA